MIDLNASPDKLRKSILQEAMQGKLTQQLPEDGDAADLLQSIAEEKQRLIQAGKIKQPKQLAAITDDEIPFKIPDNWKWVRLNNIGTWKSGSTPRRNHPEYYNGNIPWLTIHDLNDNYITHSEEKITLTGFNNSSMRMNYSGSVLLAMYGSIGKLGILDIDAVTNQAICACHSYDGVYNKFLFYYLLSQRKGLFDIGSGGVQRNISRTKIIRYVFPLPPLAEQKRIANKLDILLPKVNSFKQSVDYIQTLRSELPPRLHRSFLQEAMQGKLTQQLPEDGNATDLLQSIAKEKQRLYKTGKIKKPKHLAAITDDEIPFEIPDNWKWVRLNNLSLIMSGRDIPKKYHSDKQSQNTIPYITGAGNFSNFHLKTNTYLNKEYANVISQKDDLLITVKGTIGKLAFLPYSTAHIARQIIAIRCFNGIKSSFIERLLELVNNDLSSKSKSIIPGIKQNDLKNLLVPLPPLNEQKRIITKLNLLLSKIDRI